MLASYPRCLSMERALTLSNDDEDFSPTSLSETKAEVIWVLEVSQVAKEAVQFHLL